jgi:6-phosphofructokinase 1
VPGQRRLRLAVMHGGGPAPGMNAAVRAAVRLAIDAGHSVFGVRDGVRGLVEDRFEEMGWMTVDGWARQGGALLGTNRRVPEDRDLYLIARHLEDRKIDGLLVVGGWTAYQTAHRLYTRREDFPAFRMPIVCLPATIDNNLPGAELSVGSDTALNSICEAVDKIKQSAVASQRCVVVEVMGRRCGYLALLSGLATGAERVYLHEEGITLHALEEDLGHLIDGFRRGKRIGLIIRSEGANPLYTTSFIAALFEEEGGGLFDVRQAILGHLQQGGDPTPFDRTLPTRLAAECVEMLIREAGKPNPKSAFVGLAGGRLAATPIKEMPDLVDLESQRPLEQWWQALVPIARVMSYEESAKA